MSRYADQIRDEFGRPVPGALIYVYQYDFDDQEISGIEELAADDASPLANPLASDAFGQFYFNAPDGHKLLEIHYGGRVRFKELILVGFTGEVERVYLRADLASIAEPPAKTSRYLAEDGREGVFVFSTANLAAKVASDPGQGVYLPAAADATGATGAWVRKFPGAVEADWFGALGDAAADDTTAIQRAINHIKAAGGTVRLTPGKTYKIVNLVIDNADVTLDARGATLTSATVALQGMVALTAARCKVMGGTWKLTGGSDNPWFFEVTGTDCRIVGDPRCVKTPDAGGYHAYFRHTADGVKVDGLTVEGSNGLYVECSNASFDRITNIGRAAGGDDFFALKAISDSCRNIRISNIYGENLSSIVSIGSEVGVPGANDANFTRMVGQVTVSNVTAKNCYGLAFIKPGGIAGADYRDGTVEDIVFSNATLIDEAGTKCERPIAITPGRGARVRRVSFSNIKIRARSTGGVGRRMVLDILNLDYAGGTNEPDISGVDIQLDFQDLYNGAANGGGAPGYPFTNVVAVSNATTATGTMSDITLDVRGNGSLEAGAFVGPGLDSAVRFDRLRLTNANTSNAAGQGIIYLRSIVDAVGAIVTATGTGALYTFTDTGALQTVRGCMAKLAGDLIGADMSAGYTINWTGADAYDTENAHDGAGANPDKIYAPAWARYAEAGATVTFANVTAGVDLTVAIRKNGATSYDGTAQVCVDAASAAPAANPRTGPVPVVGGVDYFTVAAFTPTDAAADITAARSNFWVKFY